MMRQEPSVFLQEAELVVIERVGKYEFGVAGVDVPEWNRCYWRIYRKEGDQVKLFSEMFFDRDGAEERAREMAREG